MATYLLMGLSAAAAIGFMVGIACKLKPKLLILLKTLASLLFVGVGISAYFYSRHASVQQYVFILTGLVFGLVGDTLLACKELNKDNEDLFILLGIAAFAVGHIMYIVFLCSVNRMSFVEPLVAVGLSLWTILFTKMLKFDYRKLLVPAAIYCFIIMLMLIIALVTMFAVNFTASSIVMAVGALLFVVSDLVLCIIYFAPRRPRGLGAVNLSTYYAAQILIAFSLMLL